ncbi:MarR family winged helix-turn-helix transcriptional regulator [Desulfosporosinus youngiae]|uniref:Transcriptional regulator n=1 Tax=Desulfosporosinus youngiae DSM 17734 TaxID=768710 RepID=H5XWT5_9FIRM|nr:MarR family transcriptional regulator [Desulfosporosinus youngiae]EHQ90734.1 transcriptional regulator [Desulfosporosinus youngiae DSM 17734]
MKDIEEKAYVFGTIFTLANKLQILGDKMDPRLTVKQWLLLAGVLRCESTAPTLSEVAARIGSSRQNVKKMAALLEKQGFVLLERDGEDARMLRISLTEASRRHLQQREEMELRFLEEVFQGFDSRELLHLSAMIGKLEKNVGEMGRKDARKEV